jgi:hypothetical protein
MITPQETDIYADVDCISTEIPSHSQTTELSQKLRRLVAENRQLLFRVRRLEMAATGHTAVMVRRRPVLNFKSFRMHTIRFQEISRRDAEIFSMRKEFSSTSIN